MVWSDLKYVIWQSSDQESLSFLGLRWGCSNLTMMMRATRTINGRPLLPGRHKAFGFGVAMTALVGQFLLPG